MSNFIQTFAYTLFAFVIGATGGVAAVQHTFENLSGHTTGSLIGLREVCQENLPRNEYCKIEIKAVKGE